MLYSLDINIIHAMQAKCQEILNALPAIDTVGVWALQYDKSAVTPQVTMEGVATGNYQCSCMIRLITQVARESFWQILTAIKDILQACEVGSYVQKHWCYHNENPPQPCEKEILYEVVAA